MKIKRTSWNDLELSFHISDIEPRYRKNQKHALKNGGTK
jgi:hypothetical protein